MIPFAGSSAMDMVAFASREPLHRGWIGGERGMSCHGSKVKIVAFSGGCLALRDALFAIGCGLAQDVGWRA